MKNLLSRLFSASPRGKRQRAQNFRPHLEALEGRDALSCTVGLQDLGHTLVITGDASANNVKIIQDDANNQLKVICDNVTQVFSSSQITKMVIDLKEGDDLFSWTLADGSNFNFSKEANIFLGAGADTAGLDIGMGPLQGHWLQGSLKITIDAGSENDEVYANFGHKHGGQLSFTALMGSGDDSAHAALWGDVTGGADVYFWLYGQDGNDTLNVWNTYDQGGEGYGGIDVAHDATVNLYLNGGAGDDKVNVTHQGGLDGKLWMRAYGGAGNDSMDADILLTPDSDGSVDLAQKGDAGDDHMAFKLRNDAGADVAILQALMDGGDGTDQWNLLKTTSNVNKANFEGVFPIIILV